MGKRVKKKAHSSLKEKRASTSSSKAVQKEINTVDTPKAVNDGILAVKEKKVCAHFEKAVDVTKVCSKLEAAESTGCEECREGMIGLKGGKRKGKHCNNGGSSKATWICLQCGHFTCGGVGLPNSQHNHAIRHASQRRHPLVIQMENTNLRWCFSCSTLIPFDTLDDNGEQKDVLSDIVKHLRNQSSETISVDVEDIWFGSGSVVSNVKSENKVVSLPNGKEFFAVRGLVNLGNTCFFNSVMQNLLAIDVLREYLMTFDGFIGPLTSALKKIFVETIPESGARHVVNPKPLFGCICAKSSQFRGYQQQDSHELLRCLLDGLSTEDLCEKKSIKSSRENEASLPASPTFIDVIFEGQISSDVCCVECGHSSVVHEVFLDLSLPLPAKKPPPKKVQPASRTRKNKPPPKRVSRPCPKHNKDGDSRPAVSGCDPSSCKESSSVIKDVSLECSSSTDLVDNSTQPDNATSQVSDGTGQGNDAVQLYHPELVAKNEPQEPYSWMDYLEPEADSWLDYLEPVSLSDDQNLTVKNDDALVSLVSGIKDADHNVDSFHDVVNSTEQLCVDTGNKNVEPESTVNGWGEDHPVQVKDNEVLLLTYTEDSTEMSSLPVRDEEDTSDFAGLGDLFDEPEIAETPSAVSNNMHGSAYVGNGFVAGNSTESDPDEVDNSVSQVSLESCLAHFVKPELLSGEHAWHCENCSKLQQKEKQIWKNCRKSAIVLQKNLSKDECSGSKTVKDCSNSIFVADTNGNSGPDENLKIYVPVQVNGLTPALPKEQGDIYEQESSFSDATNVSVCPQLPDEVNTGSKSVDCCGGYADQVPVERLSTSEEHESGEDEEDDDNSSKSVKVMRNATKRILISKIPTILTIHLKRFGQDARGHLSKLSGHVVFKEFIDLRPYLDNRTVQDICIYRLIGVVEHSGSMRGGHYVAYVRGGDRCEGRSEEENHTQRNNVWYHASDAYVCKTTLDEVLSSEAYILFYEKVQL